MNARTILFLFLASATIVRAWLAAGHEIPAENAYQYLCSQQPTWAYHDGPAGTAMTVRLAALAGDSLWLLLGPAWALAASLAAWRLGIRTAGESAALWGAIGLNLLPAFNMASMRAGPELPALTFVLAGVSIAWDALRRQAGGVVSWAVAALAFAAGTLFAYWAVLAALTVACLPFLRPKTRRPTQIIGSALIVIATTLALLPAILWNASKNWVPIAGWTFRGLIEPNKTDILDGLVSFFVGISPLFSLALVWTLWRCLRAASTQSPAMLAGVTGLVLALPAALFVWRGWAADTMALPAAAILLPPACALLLARPWALAASAVAALGFTIPITIDQISINELQRTAAGHALAIDERMADKLDASLFLIGGDWALASSLGYHLRKAILPPEGHPLAYRLESQGEVDQFTYWPSYDDFVETAAPPDEVFTEQKAVNPFVGASAIYVGRESPSNLPQTLRGAFSAVELIQEVGPENRRLYIYLCLDYQTLPL
ncbi:MAG: hypothetical protein Fur0032_09660 [Terrimicrobiaceae bacterium]